MNRCSYPAYIPSGIEWLGNIPDHWRIGKIKDAIASCTNGVWGSDPDGINDTACIRVADFLRHNYRVSLKGRTERKIAQSDFRARNLIPGDLLLEKSGGGEKQLVGQVVSFEYSLPAVCSNFIARLRIHEGFSSRYLVYFNAYLYTIRINYKHIKQTTGIQNLDQNSYLSECFAYPDEDEQQRIAAYLDRETTRIDSLIEKKQRQIELLQEKRTALIHDAIHNSSTRTMRIGHVADQIFRPIPRKDDDTYTPVGLYNWGRGIFHKEPTAGAELGDSSFFWLDSDDLILSGQFAWEGAVALTREKDKGCVATHRYPILRGKPGMMETAYLFAFLTTKTGDFLLNEHSRGAAGRNRPLNAGTLLKESIPVPPLETQSRVSAHVYFERRIVPIIERAIQLLQEYRTSLISATVTGKIDVCKEAA